LRRNFRFSVFGLIITGNFFALFGIFRFLVQANFPEKFPALLLPSLTANTGFGTFLNQNHFALLMLMTLGLNAGLFWFGRLEKSKRICLLVLSLISWSAIVLTASRGGIISSFIVIGVLTLFASDKNKRTVSRKNRFEKFLSYGKRLLVFAFVLLALISGIIFIGQDRVLHRFEEIPAEVDDRVTTQTFQRIDAWKAGIEIVRENPFYGTGFGGYQYAVSKFIDISGQTVPRQAHNDYLEFIISAGAVGIIFGAWFLYCFFSVLKKRFKEPDDHLD
jgi:O-antigen ligase